MKFLGRKQYGAVECPALAKLRAGDTRPRFAVGLGELVIGIGVNDEAPSEPTEEHRESSASLRVGHRNGGGTRAVVADHDVPEVAGMVALGVSVAVLFGSSRIQVGAGRLEGGWLTAADLVEVKAVVSGRKSINPHGYFHPFTALPQRNRSDVLAGGIPQHGAPFRGRRCSGGGMATGRREQEEQVGWAHEASSQSSG